MMTGLSRHFKPFDHRKMNPMDDIAENPYAIHDGRGGVIHQQPMHQQQQPQRPVSAANPGQQQQQQQPPNLIVQKNTGHLPHMPQELRHTNMSQT